MTVTHDHASPQLPLAPSARAVALLQARRLNRLTIGWNALEGVVAVAAGVAAGSVSLIGFGVDSAVEVSAAGVLAWRLARERRGGCMQTSDRLATRLIAGSLFVLAGYVTVQAGADLATRSQPEHSIPGIALAALSLVVMPLLARRKRALASALGSRAVEADASQTNVCAMLSGVLLVGLTANAVLDWWWADPVAAVVIAGIAAYEGLRMWRADSLEDTCCS